MKDSGIEWIGECPACMQTVKFKYIIKESNAGEVIDKNFWHNGDELLYTCQKTPIMSDYKEFPDWKRTKAGDLLLTRNATPYIFLPKENSIYSNVVQRVEIFENYDQRYLAYAVLCGAESLTVNGDTIPSYNMEVWKNISVLNYSLEGQKRIADYLDSKCALIDSIIAKQEKIIEKLKEYKLSVITEAVTKGLDSGVEMKESGIEYIGKIPYGWHAERLKFLLNQIIDCPHETPDYSANGTHYVIRTADQDIASLRSDEKMFLLSDEEYFRRIRRGSLDKDDIVYGREGGRWGLASIVPESDKYCLGQRMLQFKCDPSKFIPEFAVLALSSETVYLQGTFDTMGSASPHVNISTVQNYWIVVPPLKEQKSIAQRIRKKISNIDYHIRETEFFLDKLVDYKKSLIYEVVTGKKEV